ncbi:MAG: hypothetical protein LUG91_07625 [Ruminococcus sp.]|nr:hypothetical protein [Ruminococcus sp.]
MKGKHMKYVLKNIKNFIKTERMIFLLALICIIASSFIINFSYGLYQNYNVIKEEEESELYEFEISFNNDFNGTYATKEMIENTVLSFSSSLDQAIDMFLIIPQCDEIDSDVYGNMLIRFCVDNGKITPCTLFKNNMQSFGTLVSGSYFSDEQEANGENVALVFDDIGYSGSLTEQLMISDDTISFQGKEYKIIGTQRMHPLIVPFKSLNDDTPIYTILFHFVKPITRSQYNEIKSVVYENFGDLASIPDLEIPESENYYLYNTIILISILIAILAAINFAVLYKYILSKRTKTLAVFRICGCTKAKTLRIFLSECMLITIPVFALTSLVYDRLILPILANHFEYIKSAYSPLLYLIIFGIYVVSSLIVLGIMIYFEFLRKSIRETKGGR